MSLYGGGGGEFALLRQTRDETVGRASPRASVSSDEKRCGMRGGERDFPARAEAYIILSIPRTRGISPVRVMNEDRIRATRGERKRQRDVSIVAVSVSYSSTIIFLRVFMWEVTFAFEFFL